MPGSFWGSGKKSAREHKRSAKKKRSLKDKWRVTRKEGNLAFCKKRKKKDAQEYVIRVLDSLIRSVDDTELQIRCSVKNKYCHSVFDCFHTGGKIYLIEEYFEEEIQTLEEKLNEEQYADIGFQESHASFIFYQLANALYYLHKKNIVHRDIRPCNIIVPNPDQLYIKLTNYVYARIFEVSEDIMVSDASILDYRSPELIKGAYGIKCDCWSLGVVLFQMLCGYTPFPGSVEHGSRATKRLISEMSYHFEHENWKNISDAAKHLIRKLLTSEEERLSAEELISHPYVTAIVEESYMRVIFEFYQLEEKGWIHEFSISDPDILQFRNNILRHGHE